MVALRGQPGERIGVGRVTGLYLLGLGQLELDEQDLLQLLRRAEVELAADARVRLVRDPFHLAREPGFQLGEPVDICGDARALHPGEQGRERKLYVAQQAGTTTPLEIGLEGVSEVDD